MIEKKDNHLSAKRAPQSICVVRLSALGDVLMFVPLIRTLQRNFPTTKLTWVISPPAYDLVQDIEGIEFIVIEKPGFIVDYWRFKQRMKGRSFDVLLAAQASGRANLLYPCIQAKRKIGYDRFRAKDLHWLFVDEAIPAGCDHTLDGFLKFAQMLGVDQFEVQWMLPIDFTSQLWVKNYLSSHLTLDGQAVDSKPILLINPAASKPERSWLMDRYVAVIHAAQSRWGMTVILTGGPTPHDRALADQILANTQDVLDLVGKTRLKQLLALIKEADLVISPDTGPSHMAAAVGTPVIALHAVTSASVSGPYSYKHLAVDCYPQAVSQVLKKTAATNPWGTHIHGFDAMQLVTVDAVLNKMDELFSSVRGGEMSC